VSTQLRLVETPAPAAKRARRARTLPRRARRPARWTNDWHLDASVRRAGQAGVAAARDALAQAAEQPLSEAS
jgi:hypothetical protein